MSNQSNPSPAYLFRRYLTRRLLRSVPSCRFLEIGVGSGKFYEELERRGFWGLCLDLNESLIQEHRQQRNSAETLLDFQSTDFLLLEDQFELIIAFEVLEHYEADWVCLRKWASLLSEGGILIFSVPAHMRQWTRNDTQAGHARRYEKADLIRKLSATHFELENLWCYGFPILNLTYPLSAMLIKGGGNGDPTSPQNWADACRPPVEPVADRDSEGAKVYATDFSRTSESGRRKFSYLASWFFQEWLWIPFLELQRMFLRTDLGTGYLVKCRKG